MSRPRPTIGLRHVALTIKNLAECEYFYTELIGMKLVWKPDENNIYLSSGQDNLALHRAPTDFNPDKYQHLDHIGFFLKEPSEVDEWYNFLRDREVKIVAEPKDHRDHTRSFYCADPDGNVVQFIYCP